MQVQNTAQLTKVDIRFIKQVRSLTPEKRAILLAVVRLMTEGQNGIPLLSDQQRTEARAIVLPELERLRAEGRPQTELEKILAEIRAEEGCVS
nr:hypothetical protein [Armatimonas sp.]